jgi:uncharacterized protein
VKSIDVHTHPIFFGEGRSRREAASLVKRARSFGIERMVALGDVLVHGRLPTEPQVAAINDETAQLMRWHPEFFIGFGCLNPTLGERAVQHEVERVLALGFRGLKLELSNNARDACMAPVMRLADRHELVVLQHAWSQTVIRERRFHTDPADVAVLARRYPNVPIIMAHLTGCGVRGVLEVQHLRNVFVDTSGAAPEEGIVDYAVEKLGAERVLYGSDWPIRDFPVALARITGSDLSASARRRILHDNARHLLRLP